MTVEERLAAWLAPRLSDLLGDDVGAVRVGPLAAPGAGQSNETALFDATWSRGPEPRQAALVLRRQPGAQRLFLDADVGREFEVMASLERSTDLPLPRMLWFEPGSDAIGTPFFVMSQVPGRVPTGRPSIHTAGWLPELRADQRTRLWSAAMEVVAGVHAVDWSRTHPWLAPPGGPSVRARVADLRRWYSWVTAGRSFPLTDAGLEVLEAGAGTVDCGPPVLAWGDARIGNMIFAEDLRVAAAIDWELAWIGPPEADLGHWLMFDRFFTEGAGVTPLAGWPDRSATIACYEQATGRRLGDVGWFELLAEVTVAVTLIRQADLRVAAGLLPVGTRMGHANAVTRMLAGRMGLPLPELDADYLAHRKAHAPRA